MPADPFAHHPVLRDQILDPETSRWRTVILAELDVKMKSLGLPDNWRRSDAEIEASRRTFMGQRQGGDLWVFGYGSLMWDPAIRFADVRRARIRGYTRSFCLRDTLGGRGTAQAPGLMVGLDIGEACEGLAFRISAAQVETETDFLWRREMCVPAYLPIMVAAETDHGPITVLAFAADHAAEMISIGMSRAEQVQCIATGSGFLGTSLQYLENLAAHFAAIGIEDAEISSLLAEATALTARSNI